MDQFERTLALIKPDGMKHRDTITRRIRDAGFVIVQSRIVRLTPEQASELYRSKIGHPNYHAMIVALTVGPIQAMCVSKVCAVAELNWLIGPERYQDAVRNAPGSIRAIFGDSRDELKNAIHGSEDAESARFEVRFFFPLLILEPIFNEQKLNDYLAAMVNPTLMDGLYMVAKERPNDPMLWLSDWLLLNNPYKPKTVTTSLGAVYNVVQDIKQDEVLSKDDYIGAQSMCDCAAFRKRGLCSCSLSTIAESESMVE
ncbi:nucleoside diphosphate kinase homolog 5-like [Topomyia yanbarensis]|uniref:nucleoside diphosphate kinase homolog 5-like n=1 Tax=Topomyia yanbarensis TaxID=2498891 RepID=UPI00273C8F01|nr:nucleoside diphosphate kinase homolog 5-like [Topomyia yanbarensis]